MFVRSFTSCPVSTFPENGEYSLAVARHQSFVAVDQIHPSGLALSLVTSRHVILSTCTPNERQIKVLNRLLDGFDGKLTTSKWAQLAKCSQDTAYRDILDLIERGALRKDSGGGRSTSYSLAVE